MSKQQELQTNETVYAMRCSSLEQKKEIKQTANIIAVYSDRTIPDIILTALQKLKKERGIK